MSNFAGITNFEKSIPNIFSFFDTDAQPVRYKLGENFYTIVFHGNIYNLSELKSNLKKFDFATTSYEELIIYAFIEYGYNICKYLNGAFSFAIWEENSKELFIARDQFGIKPLYYCFNGDDFLFATEIKTILESLKTPSILNEVGICELFGIGPCHTPGQTPYKDIFELKPAHFAILKKDFFCEKEYWKLETKEHTDNFQTTCDTIFNLIDTSIENQIQNTNSLCTLLSGGLDSSIISTFAAKKYKKLNTFSVDYLDNDKNFKKSDFQPNSDKYYINIMSQKLNSNHHNIIIDTPELFKTLEDAVDARGYPGMADVDSSLLLFSQKIKPHSTVALSGECADEIFGGYPWFFRKDSLESNTFPWSLAIKERQNLLSNNISERIDLSEYVNLKYNASIKDIEYLPDENNTEKLERKLLYLTSHWFMQTLLDRGDKMSMYSGLEIRVPFCDVKIVEYMWNVPWEMKAYKGREKGLLRHIFKDFLPEEIVYRKKSPYPKTYNPNYLSLVKEKLQTIINSECKLTYLLNKKYIQEIIDSNGENFKRPWFGQLMTAPQLMAYLLQVNFWLEKYNIKFDF